MEKLLKYQSEITKLQYLINILNWELKITAPEESKNYLIDTIADLTSKRFKLETDKTYGQLLMNTINSDEFLNLKDEEQRYIKNLLKRFQEKERIPQDFYKEYSKQLNIATQVWEKAKKTNNYQLFKPELEKNIEMVKKYYSYIDPSSNLYDVMLEHYEPGMTSDVIDKLFDELKQALIPLIKQYDNNEVSTYTKDYTADELMECARYLLEYIGFDMNKGAIDIYPHGFTEKMNNNDIRITFSHIDKPTKYVGTVIHEGGHGIFEQNINDYLSKYTNECVELYGLHESQSRFYENILGRNINFWYPIYDKIKELLKLDLTIEEFVNLLNTVKKIPIRIDSDELTYCLHIIVRYEIERDLFNGNITVDQLPTIWNQKIKDYLGIEVKTDSEGLMQDIHWSQGAFGYFPSYLLGNIYDGMFIEVIEEQLGPIDELLKNGKIKEITNFLIENIYQYGGAYNSKEVLEKVYRKELSVKPIINYFNNKYSK